MVEVKDDELISRRDFYIISTIKIGMVVVVLFMQISLSYVMRMTADRIENTQVKNEVFYTDKLQKLQEEIDNVNDFVEVRREQLDIPNKD